MKASEEIDLKEPESHTEKLKLLGLIIFVMGLSCVSVYGSIQEMMTISSLVSKPVFFKSYTFAFAILLLVPIFLTCAYIYWQKFIGTMTQRKSDLAMKLIIFSSIGFFVIRLVSGYILPSYYEGRGYIHCYYLSGTNLGSYNIWVKDNGYCFETSSSVRVDLLSWMEEEVKKGRKPTVTEVQEKAALLKMEYEM
ncbi:hypothetical protein [Algicola sagamiensis]|uniref:hypothetical protein n=1 Tax=Algicola sagamiensis TaxID=163869 RepID=UPI00037FE534|nr:hypothetical protein [Algicola sagamiensis]